jgi:alpha-N-acetylglucosaminidase
MLIASSNRTPMVVTAPGATPLEFLAADEICRYMEAITGQRPARVVEGDPGIEAAAGSVFVASALSSPAARRLAAAAGLGAPSLAGAEGFVLDSREGEGGQGRLALVGQTPAATLHAVYDFLETHLHCGFFEGGERVPRRAEIALPILQTVRRPRFAWRAFSQGCVQLYSTPYWSLQDWQREIDWLARKKFNVLFFHVGWVRGRTHSLDPVGWRVWRAFGLDQPPEDEGVGEAVALCRGVMAYARARGLRILTPWLFGGAVPAAFRDRYPECRYLEMRWERTSPEVHLDPRDPMFARVAEAFVREHAVMFGTDHLYVMPLYAEVNPAATRAEAQAVRAACARAWCAGMRAADPQGVAQIDSWSFLGHPNLSALEVREVLTSVPDEAVFISDTWADAYPLAEGLDFFFGRPWAFSVLHCMAGNTGLHGDVHGLVRRVQSLARSPDAGQLRHFTVLPEAIGHNPLFYDLLAQLAWDPEAVDPAAFALDYARRRWGQEALPRTARLTWELLDSVYSREDWTGPQYQQGPGVTRDTRLRTRLPFCRRLRQALNLAVEEAGCRPADPLLLQDVVEIGAQFLGELYNAHWLRLQDAFDANDAGAVAAEGQVLVDLLQVLGDLLRAHPEWTLGAEVRRAVRTGLEPAVAAREVKARYSYLGILYGVGWDSYPFLVDYARRNRAELVLHYYLPRLRLYLQALDRRLQDAAGKPFPADHPGAEGLAEDYREVAHAFVEGPVPLEQGQEPDPAGALAAARRALNGWVEP